jgi:hypothetical protein
MTKSGKASKYIYICADMSRNATQLRQAACRNSTGRSKTAAAGHLNSAENSNIAHHFQESAHLPTSDDDVDAVFRMPGSPFVQFIEVHIVPPRDSLSAARNFLLILFPISIFARTPAE